MSKPSLDAICHTENLDNISNKQTWYKNTEKLSCIGLILNNRLEKFLKHKTIEIGISVFHKMVYFVL